MTETAGTIASAPDWETVSRELRCPLCEYNLRGLVDPRCPECGFTFTWAELIDAETNRHPYLFEHQRKRNVWSFFMTFWNESFPSTFWRELSPAQPIRVRRLMIYWLLSNVLLFTTLVIPLWGGARQVIRFRSARLQNVTILPNGDYSETIPNSNFRNPFLPTQQFGMSVPQTVVTIYPKAQLDFDYPPLFSARGLELAQLYSRYRSGPNTVILVIAWPWITALGLMIFQASLRRAKIRQIHIYRCALYSCSFPLIYIGVTFICEILRITFPWAILTCAMVCTWRLGTAYKKYMRFDHAYAVALSTQVITVMVLALLTPGAYRWFL